VAGIAPKNKKTSVLVVEDEAIIALDITQRLIKLGYAPLGVVPDNGPAAIEAAGRLRPELALMDVTLAGSMDGIEAAGTIISRYDIPVVFLTAHADEKTLSRAKAAGCHGYVIKPIDERWLLTALEMALAQHDAEVRLKKSERLFRSIFDSAAAGIVMTDAGRRILRVNATFAAMLGYEPEELIGKTTSELTYPADAAVSLEMFNELIGGVVSQYRIEKRFLRRDGTFIWLDSSAKAVPGEDGKIGLVVRVMIDATKRKALEEELMRQATTDFLTGIANRREYIHLSERELSRAKRHDTPLAALSLDIDHFKRINDTYGHNTGDEVLRPGRRRGVRRHPDRMPHPRSLGDSRTPAPGPGPDRNQRGRPRGALHGQHRRGRLARRRLSRLPARQGGRRPVRGQTRRAQQGDARRRHRPLSDAWRKIGRARRRPRGRR